MQVSSFQGRGFLASCRLGHEAILYNTRGSPTKGHSLPLELHAWRRELMISLSGETIPSPVGCRGSRHQNLEGMKELGRQGGGSFKICAQLPSHHWDYLVARTKYSQ